jgi:hypothetical protein
MKVQSVAMRETGMPRKSGPYGLFGNICVPEVNADILQVPFQDAAMQADKAPRAGQPVFQHSLPRRPAGPVSAGRQHGPDT